MFNLIFNNTIYNYMVKMDLVMCMYYIVNTITIGIVINNLKIKFFFFFFLFIKRNL
jgi:hypothetical protein